MKKQFKLNVDLRGKRKGDVLVLDVNPEGLPFDSYWNRRVQDSKIDGCIEEIKVAPKQRKE